MFYKRCEPTIDLFNGPAPENAIKKKKSPFKFIAAPVSDKKPSSTKSNGNQPNHDLNLFPDSPGQNNQKGFNFGAGNASTQPITQKTETFNLLGDDIDIIPQNGLKSQGNTPQNGFLGMNGQQGMNNSHQFKQQGHGQPFGMAPQQQQQQNQDKYAALYYMNRPAANQFQGMGHNGFGHQQHHHHHGHHHQNGAFRSHSQNLPQGHGHNHGFYQNGNLF